MKALRHLAIIMDGNGRWAQLRGHPRTSGHIKGARVAKKIITACSEQGIQNLTLYAFSSENWLRPPLEVAFLMNLLRRYLKRETQNLVKQNIRFRAIGELSRLPSDVLSAVDYATKITEKNTGLNLVFAISYGSRQEITSAIQKIATKVADGALKAQDIDESVIQAELMTSGSPDPDLVIRTSGEQRLSNFLLWQSAYSELVFSNTLWPDFTVQELESCIGHFNKRERRFGTVPNHENPAH